MKQTRKTTTLPAEVVLATAEGDLTMCVAKSARTVAAQLATKHNTTVYLRHPVTDKVLGKAKPGDNA